MIHVTLQSRRLRLVAAFAAVYLFWGSTYFAIHVALQTLPPFALGALRFAIAGIVMLIWARVSGAGWPSRAQWRVGAVGGLLMLFVGNGTVIWAQQGAPSGLVALLVTSVALWMVLIDALRPGGERPRAAVWFGLALGAAGMALLVSNEDTWGAGVPLVEALVLVLGTLGWAAGSQYTRLVQAEGPPTQIIGLQLMFASGAFALTSLVTGDWTRLDPAGVTWEAAAAVAWLVVFGSLVGYTVYLWLTRNASPAHVSTYAYVNPVVALLIGALLGDEPLTLRTGIAAAIILSAVALITAVKSRPRVSDA